MPFPARVFAEIVVNFPSRVSVRFAAHLPAQVSTRICSVFMLGSGLLQPLLLLYLLRLLQTFPLRCVSEFLQAFPACSLLKVFLLGYLSGLLQPFCSSNCQGCCKPSCSAICQGCCYLPDSVVCRHITLAAWKSQRVVGSLTRFCISCCSGTLSACNPYGIISCRGTWLRTGASAGMRSVCSVTFVGDIEGSIRHTGIDKESMHVGAPR